MPLTTFKPHSFKNTNLFKPLQVGKMLLQHRIVMSPQTRFRNDDNFVPSDESVEYYSQRSKRPGSLIVSEATYVSAKAGGYPWNAPGIWSSEQISQWKKIADAVHKNKSYFYVQILALGREADPATLSRQGLPFVGPSDNYRSPSKKKDAIVAHDMLRALTREEIHEYIADFGKAAENAIVAGADGVEILGGNAYLINQFLDPLVNQRTDEYGGSIENRSRFCTEIVDTITKAIGADRLGIRLSPFSLFGAMSGNHPQIVAQYSHLLGELEQRAQSGNRLAYVSLVEPRQEISLDASGVSDVAVTGDTSFARTVWKGTLIKAGSFADHSQDIETVLEDDNSLIAFGRYFISTPDLVDRLEHGLPLNSYDKSTFYAGGARGYIDYPTYAQAMAL